MDVRVVDTSATAGRSALHDASPVSKLVAFALVLSAVVVQRDPSVIVGIAVLLASAAVGSRLPLRPVFALAAYPAVFALAFAFAAAPGPLIGATIVARAITAALAAVLLAFTTPYPQLFAPVQAITPGIVGDSMLMTYRALFLLGEKFDDLLTSVRLRSGLSRGHPVRAARAGAQALGGLVLYAFDLSLREYDVMRLRGYEQRLRAALPSPARPAFDVSLVVAAAVILALAIAWPLGPYPIWLPPLVASPVLAAAILWRLMRR